MKLVRLIAKHRSLGRTGALRAIAAGRVAIDHQSITDTAHEVDRFAKVLLDTDVVQPGVRALYLMLHKPAGVVSATTDPEHQTVIDLIDDPDKHTLHIAGRLDRATTGLALLTNDGRWSKRITEKAFECPKTYLVETVDPINQSAIQAFADGFYFHTENITTLPAELEILDTHRARLTLREGRYHQVKRMFHRVNNRVVRLHRESIGGIRLPEDLLPGQWRPLSQKEMESFAQQTDASRPRRQPPPPANNTEMNSSPCG